MARHYAAFRPTYPASLFAELARLCPQHELAWDCATGSGQAARDLVRHFRRVIATDASPAQMAQAPPHPQILYRVAPAEASGLETASVDLITVAQALHWFDLDGFYQEVRRVLRPGGILAAWCYGTLQVEGEEVQRRIQHFYHEEVGPYWPPERHLVENGYADLPFPFTPLPFPTLAMEATWSMEQLLGYLRSWSASGRCMQATGHDPVAALEPSLRSLWGDPARPRTLTWPLSLRVGRI